MGQLSALESQFSTPELSDSPRAAPCCDLLAYMIRGTHLHWVRTTERRHVGYEEDCEDLEIEELAKRSQFVRRTKKRAVSRFQLCLSPILRRLNAKETNEIWLPNNLAEKNHLLSTTPPSSLDSKWSHLYSLVCRTTANIVCSVSWKPLRTNKASCKHALFLFPLACPEFVTTHHRWPPLLFGVLPASKPRGSMDGHDNVWWEG